MATNSISSQHAYEAVQELMSDGKKRSFSELADFLYEKFGANSNQISGLIFRMHKKKKILKKLKDEPTYYVAYSQQGATVDLSDELESLIVKFRKSLVSESLNIEAPLENIKFLRTIIPKLEAIHEEMEIYNEKL